MIRRNTKLRGEKNNKKPRTAETTRAEFSNDVHSPSPRAQRQRPSSEMVAHSHYCSCATSPTAAARRHPSRQPSPLSLTASSAPPPPDERSPSPPPNRPLATLAAANAPLPLWRGPSSVYMAALRACPGARQSLGNARTDDQVGVAFRGGPSSLLALALALALGRKRVWAWTSGARVAMGQALCFVWVSSASGFSVATCGSAYWAWGGIWTVELSKDGAIPAWIRVVAAEQRREGRQVATEECRRGRGKRGPRDVWGRQKRVKASHGENEVGGGSCSGRGAIVEGGKVPPARGCVFSRG